MEEYTGKVLKIHQVVLPSLTGVVSHGLVVPVLPLPTRMPVSAPQLHSALPSIPNGMIQKVLSLMPLFLVFDALTTVVFHWSWNLLIGIKVFLLVLLCALSMLIPTKYATLLFAFNFCYLFPLK